MLKPSDEIGIRGPYGNPFPFEKATGKDILFVAGGLGLAPLRPLIHKVMDEKKSFKKIVLICGSRNPRDILFKDDVDSWQKKGLQLFLGVRKSLQFFLSAREKDNNPQGNPGLVAEDMKIPKILFKHAYAFVCGPPVMIDPAMNSLSSLDIHEDNIFTSLEAHMKCGVGKCGHCIAYGKYICTEGPVFSYADIKDRRLYKY
jgi:NAD(P)H-flavin reductase